MKAKFSKGDLVLITSIPQNQEFLKQYNFMLGIIESDFGNYLQVDNGDYSSYYWHKSHLTLISKGEFK